MTLPRVCPPGTRGPVALLPLASLCRRVALLLLALLLAACGTRSDHTLVVGMDLSYPPFETLDASGQPTGISVDLARALGDYLGRPVRIENIPFVGLIPALKSKRIDLVISSMTDTPERRESIAFSDPYLTTGLALLLPKNSAIQDAAALDRAGAKIAVRQGTTGESWARANVKQATLLPLEKESTAVMEVLQGRADAFIYDQMSVWQNWKNHPDKTVAQLQPLRTEAWAIGLRQNDSALREQVNAFLKAYRADGGFDRLGDKYLAPQKADFAARGVPFFF